MPTFDFTSPEGKTYSVDGPDGATSAQAFQILQQHLGTPEQPSVGMGEDAAKGLGSGLASATIGTLGGIGDLRGMASRGVDALGAKLGVDLSPAKSIGSFIAPSIAAAPTSEDIRSTVTNPIVSPDYQPQTGLGSALKTTGEFLPGMVDPELAGPAAFKAAAKLFASRVAAPAIASEGAGALTKGTPLEPYARVGGALLGGYGGSKVTDAMAEANAVRTATPSLADTKTAATNAYDRLTSGNAASPIPQAELDTLAGDIRTKLNNTGVRPSNAKGIHDALDELQNPATKGVPDVQDLVAARESIKNQLGSPDASKKGAFIALPKIEAAIERLSPGTMADLKEADKNYGAFKAAETLDKKVASADLRASTVDSGMNVGNKIRQKVASLLESGDAKYLSAETKADLEKIARGTASQNIIRKIDRVLGGGGGLGMLAGGIGAGYEADGWQGALLGAAAAHGLRSTFNRSVISQSQKVAEAIRRRSPLGQQNPALLPPKTNVALGALLPALLARPQQ